jgi:hypothetical protein
VTVERKYPHGPLDVERLVAFEARLVSPLPEDYRAFLLGWNGVKVVDGTDLGGVPGGTRVEALFGLHEGPLWVQLAHAHDRMKGLLPPALLVIGSDPYGNYFGFALGGREAGTVFFIDHERLPADLASLTRVTPSLAALLEHIGMNTLEVPAPASVAEAVQQADADALRTMIDGGLRADGFVHAAVRAGDLRIVRLVLEHGGDANELGGIGGETPLFVAAREGRADIAQLLLAHGGDPSATCSVGGTPMEMAAHAPDVLEVLARAGATPTTMHLRAAVQAILERHAKTPGR